MKARARMTPDMAVPTLVGRERPVAPRAACECPPLSLSLELRARTAALHGEVERSLGLPYSISTLAQYQACLKRFDGFYGPLEAALQRFEEWPEWEIDLHARAHAPSLALDLESLEELLKAIEVGKAGEVP